MPWKVPWNLLLKALSAAGQIDPRLICKGFSADRKHDWALVKDRGNSFALKEAKWGLVAPL